LAIRTVLIYKLMHCQYGKFLSLYPALYFFKNSLIIHEEKTKKNHKRVVSLYVIEISLDLHKL
jgi:hypothetical protein